MVTYAAEAAEGEEGMNLQDYFKKSVWESFVSSQALTDDVVVQIVMAMTASLILGLFIYKI